MQRRAGFQDTHPSLKQRLAALHTTHELPNNKAKGEYLFHIGRILLKQENTEGLAYLKKASESAPNHIRIDACELLIYYYFDRGELDQAQPWVDKLDNINENYERAQYERTIILANDTFIAPDLSDKIIEEIKTLVNTRISGHQVYFVEKIVKYFPEEPFYILAILKKNGPLRVKANIDIILNDLGDLPIEYACYDMMNSKARKKMKKIGLRLM